MFLQLSGGFAEALMEDGVDRLIYHRLCKSLPLLACLILSVYICQKNFLMVMDGSGRSSNINLFKAYTA